MKTTGWIIIVLGLFAFMGAVSAGHSVFGPAFWMALGAFLLYRSNNKNKDKENC